MIFSDHFDDGQAEATAAILGGIVEAENLGLFIVLDTLSCVLNFQHTLAIMLHASYRQGSTAEHGIKGIDGQIEEGLPELGIIAIYPQRFTGHFPPEDNTLAGGLGFEQRHAVVNDLT